ncbi:MAG: hypothetical protein OXU68_09220 [Bacteroidota bacterium]|nr:hypothetical protein [Bacteroidota bacterium]
MPKAERLSEVLRVSFDEVSRSRTNPDQGGEWVDDIADAYQDFVEQLARKERQKNDERFRQGRVFVRTSIGCLIFVGLVIVAHGIEAVPFALDKTTLGILLGTTTVNMLAPYFLMAKYLFNGHSPPN